MLNESVCPDTSGASLSFREDNVRTIFNCNSIFNSVSILLKLKNKGISLKYMFVLLVKLKGQSLIIFNDYMFLGA